MPDKRDDLLQQSNLLSCCGVSSETCLLGFLQGFQCSFPWPSPRENDALQSRQVVSAVGGELAERTYSEGSGKWLLFQLATCHEWDPPGIDIGPNTV